MFEEPPRPRRKFPLRTIVLLVIAAVVTLRYLWLMRAPEPERSFGMTVIEVEPLSPDAGE